MSADRIARLASQLLGDLAAVDEISDYRAAADQQRLQLIVDAFERVGEIAIEQQTLARVEALKALGPQATLIDHGSPQTQT